MYGLWVRKDLFEQAGLPLPTTYEQVLTSANTLTNSQTYGITLPAGQNIATHPLRECIHLWVKLGLRGKAGISRNGKDGFAQNKLISMTVVN
ncbi:MAG: extracellular solute-binding protein [Chloroflexi bacterium]|nr:extracellular solute-binding protein [Chloroflexota bacterium]